MTLPFQVYSSKIKNESFKGLNHLLSESVGNFLSDFPMGNDLSKFRNVSLSFVKSIIEFYRLLDLESWTLNDFFDSQKNENFAENIHKNYFDSFYGSSNAIDYGRFIIKQFIH